MSMEYKNSLDKIVIFVAVMLFSWCLQAMETTRDNLFSIGSIGKIDSFMREHKLKYKKSLFIFDLDETLGRVEYTYEGHKFVLLGNKERCRTYLQGTQRICKELNLTCMHASGDYITEHEHLFEVSYQPLEAETKIEINRLKKKSAKVILCSGLENNEKHHGGQERMRLIANFDVPFYFIEGNKIRVLEENIDLGKIQNIIFIDNNKNRGPSSIKSFLEAAQQLGPEFKDKRIIGIHLTYFDEMHSLALLRLEYQTFVELMAKRLEELVGEYEGITNEEES